ncbi:hypothetical protein ACJMK2_007871 [Sinanodonta woodiana]|uniref:Secreted protein n=1 Tax=Sinanodonta woodiana TaxID=1069815 RepID=A0ABD3VJU6_SINWO
MVKHCWLAFICLMYACAVHGDEDDNRWNTLCIPADIWELDRDIAAAVVSDIYCAYCQRIGDLQCILRWCNRAFILALAAVAKGPFPITEQHYGWPLFPYWPYIHMCPWYPHDDDSD